MSSSNRKTVRSRRWLQPFGALAGVSAAVILIMVAFTQRPIDVQIQSSSSMVDGVQVVAQNGMLDHNYMLHLGSYQSELGAQLMWTGLEADPGTMLEGLNLIFKSYESDDGTFIDVLVGTFSSQDVADGYCAWLNDKKVSCSVVDG